MKISILTRGGVVDEVRTDATEPVDVDVVDLDDLDEDDGDVRAECDDARTRHDALGRIVF